MKGIINKLNSKVKETSKFKILKRSSKEQTLPKKNSVLFSSKTLSKIYTNKETKIIILEIANSLTQKLILNKTKTNCIRLFISYQNEDIPSLKMTLNLVEATNSYSKIIKTIIKNYNINVINGNYIKKIGISFSTL